MATIKSFTDLSQSKKLAEILPLESADCFWDYDEMQKFHRISWFEDGYNKESQLMLNENNICAWSLAALLEAIPQEIFDGEYILNITEGCDNRWALTYDHFENRNHSYFGLSICADNLIDAFYKLILKLHERKML